jgi:hypothetical protein
MLRSIYFAYCVLWITFEIQNNNFGGVSESIKAFRVQARAIQIISGTNNYESCRQIFKDCTNLAVISLYILEEVWYINSYKGNLKQYTTIHGHTTISKLNFQCNFAVVLLKKKVFWIRCRTRHTWCRNTTYVNTSSSLPFVIVCCCHRINRRDNHISYHRLLELDDLSLVIFSVERTERDLITAQESDCWWMHNKVSCQVKSMPRDGFSRYARE